MTLKITLIFKGLTRAEVPFSCNEEWFHGGPGSPEVWAFKHQIVTSLKKQRGQNLLTNKLVFSLEMLMMVNHRKSCSKSGWLLVFKRPFGPGLDIQKIC
jgi:hypothetical protein